MRVGIVSYWFNRGQAHVQRWLRSAIDELGHETFVLARPTRAANVRPGHIGRTDIWDQPRITEGSAYEMPADEYLEWARANDLDAVLTFANYQFEEIAWLRAAGVRTIGCFMWERFGPQHVEGAKRALDVVYCFGEEEQRRYAELGIDSPRIPWAPHPELDRITPNRPDDVVRLYMPGGHMTIRKPLKVTLKGFRRTRNERLRLVIKSQVRRRTTLVNRALEHDPRMELVSEDLPTAEHLQLIADCHACLAPSRWEGLGLHLYEALAFGMPVITNDAPPMNEVVEDGLNGILVGGVPDGFADSGIPAFSPEVSELTAAIEAIANPRTLSRLSEGAVAMRERRPWSATVEAVGNVLERAGIAPPVPA